MGNNSTAARIRARLGAVVDGLAGLIRTIPARFVNVSSPGIVIFAPDYSWTEPTASQRAIQLQLKRDYEPLAEIIRLLSRHAPEELLQQLKEADDGFRIWLELASNWSLRPDPSENERLMRESAHAFEGLLSILENVGDKTTIVIPDTNAIIAQPDPTQYRQLVGLDAFVFLLIPTVLGELDRLKVEHRNPEFREKAKKAISRIKGWRHQGHLLSGVVVDGSLTVRASHEEPDVKGSLSWLDDQVQDDRILASVIAVEAANPAARVVLVTGDINLQNKADAALIETCEVPEPSEV